jgi:hypothetical protein
MATIEEINKRMEDFKKFEEDLRQKMSSELQERRESFIKNMISQKGYSHLIPTEATRFPKINRSIGWDGWEYIFADNGTKQGQFIVAIGPYKFNETFDLSNPSIRVSADIKCTFDWQDTNFDAVILP